MWKPINIIHDKEITIDKFSGGLSDCGQVYEIFYEMMDQITIGGLALVTHT